MTCRTCRGVCSQHESPLPEIDGSNIQLHSWTHRNPYCRLHGSSLNLYFFNAGPKAAKSEPCGGLQQPGLARVLCSFVLRAFGHHIHRSCQKEEHEAGSEPQGFGFDIPLGQTLANDPPNPPHAHRPLPGPPGCRPQVPAGSDLLLTNSTRLVTKALGSLWSGLLGTLVETEDEDDFVDPAGHSTTRLVVLLNTSAFPNQQCSETQKAFVAVVCS